MVCDAQAVEQPGPPVDAARSADVGLALSAHSVMKKERSVMSVNDGSQSGPLAEISQSKGLAESSESARDGIPGHCPSHTKCAPSKH